MSNKERCIDIINSLDEGQLGNIAAILEAAKHAIEEAADDAFCERLYQDYENSSDKGEFLDIADVAQELGVTL